MRKRIKNIKKFVDNPIQVQESVFNYLIKKGIKTKFGEDHQFEKITNYITFKNQIPIRTYEDFDHYITKIRKIKCLEGVVHPDIIDGVFKVIIFEPPISFGSSRVVGFKSNVKSQDKEAKIIP